MAFSLAKSFLCVTLFTSLLSLSGCDKIKSLIEKDSGCGDEIALTAVDNQLQKGVLTATKTYLRDADNVDSDSVKNFIKQIKTQVNDVRTETDKKMCAGTLKVTVSNDMLTLANAVREARGDKPIKEIVLGQDFNLDGNAISQDIEYQLQPTDDGKKVIATLQNTSSLQNFLARLAVDASQPVPKNTAVTASVVASTVIVASKPTPKPSSSSAATDKEANGPASQKDESSVNNDETANTDNSNDEKINAMTAQAQARLAAKRKQFNEMWNQASPEAQASLTDDQKNWVEERDATCQGEAEQAKTGYEEATRTQCMARMLGERYTEVKEYFDNYEQ